MDIDQYDTTFEKAIDVFKKYYFICYSTSSSRKEYPKFRIVLPLTDVVDQKDIRHFWFALNTEFNSLGDKQTKDLSRMYYVPAKYPDAYNFIFTNKSSTFVSPSDLMKKHEYVSPNNKNSIYGSIPDHILKKIEEHRKNNLTNTAISWSSYHDCPFVNKNMILEYRAITESGWYTKMYQIMVSIAANAIRMNYPITSDEIVTMIRQIDSETGGWYKNRPVKIEAERAIAFVLTN